MCDYLASTGDRTPALLTSDGADSYTQTCVTAYERWCKTNRKQAQVLRAGHDPAAAAALLRRVLRMHGRPDAIVGLEDFHLDVLQAEVGAAGLRVPVDIALGCFTEADQQSTNVPPVARMTVSPRTLAANAVNILIDAVEGRDVRTQLQSVDFNLMTV